MHNVCAAVRKHIHYLYLGKCLAHQSTKVLSYSIHKYENEVYVIILFKHTTYLENCRFIVLIRPYLNIKDTFYSTVIKYSAIDHHQK